jgi:hypothetical protein
VLVILPPGTRRDAAAGRRLADHPGAMGESSAPAIWLRSPAPSIFPVRSRSTQAPLPWRVLANAR